MIFSGQTLNLNKFYTSILPQATQRQRGPAWVTQKLNCACNMHNFRIYTVRPRDSKCGTMWVPSIKPYTSKVWCADSAKPTFFTPRDIGV